MKKKIAIRKKSKRAIRKSANQKAGIEQRIIIHERTLAEFRELEKLRDAAGKEHQRLDQAVSDMEDEMYETDFYEIALVKRALKAKEVGDAVRLAAFEITNELPNKIFSDKRQGSRRYKTHDTYDRSEAKQIVKRTEEYLKQFKIKNAQVSTFAETRWDSVNRKMIEGNYNHIIIIVKTK